MKLDLEKLFHYIECQQEAQQELRGKEIVMLMGQTGTGKSTTIHFLAGHKMVEKEVAQETIIEHGQRSRKKMTTKKVLKSIQPIDGINIGHDMKSETLFTRIYKSQSGQIFCDTPGFNDNRGVEVDISNAIGIKLAIRACKNVKIIYSTEKCRRYYKKD